MPKQRLQPRRIGVRPDLQPVARPRDAFVPGAAARGASADLERLASSLGNIAPEVARFSQRLAQKKNREQAAAGKQRFLELLQERKDVQEAMAQGLIEAKDNPFFLAGMRETAGRVQADRYANDLMIRSEAELADNPDMGAFDDLAGQLYSDVEKAAADVWDDEFFRAGFQGTAQAHTQTQRNAHARRAGAIIQEQSAEQVGDAVSQRLSLTLSQGESLDGFVTWAESFIDQRVLDNREGSTMTTHGAVDAIIAVAKARRDLTLLDLIDPAVEGSIMSGPEGSRAPLGGTVYAQNARQAAFDEIHRSLSLEQSAAERAERIENQEGVDATAEAYLEALLETDPLQRGDFDIEPWVERMAKYDVGAAAGLATGNAQLANAFLQTDQGLFNGLYTRIWTDSDVTPLEITGWIGQEDGLTVEDAQVLMNNLLQTGAMGKPGEEAYDWFNNPLFKAVYNDVEGQFNAIDGVLSGTAKENAARAKSELVTNWFRHLGTEAGQTMLANPTAAQAWLNTYSQAIVRRYGGGAAITTQGASEVAPGQPAEIGEARAGVGVNWTTEAVLTHDELHELQSGQMTAAMQDKLAGWGLAGTVHEMRMFVTRQAELLAGVPEEEEAPGAEAAEVEAAGAAAAEAGGGAEPPAEPVEPVEPVEPTREEQKVELEDQIEDLRVQMFEIRKPLIGAARGTVLPEEVAEELRQLEALDAELRAQLEDIEAQETQERREETARRSRERATLNP